MIKNESIATLESLPIQLINRVDEIFKTLNRPIIVERMSV